MCQEFAILKHLDYELEASELKVVCICVCDYCACVCHKGRSLDFH